MNLAGFQSDDLARNRVHGRSDNALTLSIPVAVLEYLDVQPGTRLVFQEKSRYSLWAFPESHPRVGNSANLGSRQVSSSGNNLSSNLHQRAIDHLDVQNGESIVYKEGPNSSVVVCPASRAPFEEVDR